MVTLMRANRMQIGPSPNPHCGWFQLLPYSVGWVGMNAGSALLAFTMHAAGHVMAMFDGGLS